MDLKTFVFPEGATHQAKAEEGFVPCPNRSWDGDRQECARVNVLFAKKISVTSSLFSMGTRYDPPSPTNCLGDLVSRRGGGGREGPGEEEASCLARPGGIEKEEEEKPFLRDCAALHNDVPLFLPPPPPPLFCYFRGKSGVSSEIEKKHNSPPPSPPLSIVTLLDRPPRPKAVIFTYSIAISCKRTTSHFSVQKYLEFS